MAEQMKASFQTLLIKDEVIAGFAYFKDAETIEYMLHPLDQNTGIQYRLLPMTRSIIAELVDPAQADMNLRLIDEHLKCPDGVRLMDRPARYEGGVSTIFRRAEQAANVGREISLQYVHAHIRYLEAAAKLGDAERARKGCSKSIRSISARACLMRKSARAICISAVRTEISRTATAITRISISCAPAASQ